MNSYEEKRAARIDRLNRRADARQSEADRLYNQGSEALSQIPFGQPILVGHHSEKADRNYRSRAADKIDRSMEMSKNADRLRAMAKAAENNTAISSDDPEAVDKLREKLAELEAGQAHMKAMNAHFRKHKTMKGFSGLTDEAATKIDVRIETGYSWQKCPAPSYALSNNNANIRRIRDRIAGLEKRATADAPEGWEFDNGRVVANAAENRVQILYESKPDAPTRDTLKRNGFRWAPSQSAWQRHLNNAGIYAAKRVTGLV